VLVTGTVLNCGRSTAAFQNGRQVSGNGRFHQTLHGSTKSANGGFHTGRSIPAEAPSAQSAPAFGFDQRIVW